MTVALVWLLGVLCYGAGFSCNQLLHWRDVNKRKVEDKKYIIIKVPRDADWSDDFLRWILDSIEQAKATLKEKQNLNRS